MDKIIRMLFPTTSDYNLLKIDSESYHFITPYNVADKISQLMISYLLKLNLDVKECNITDCMSGVGGDTLSFCKYFKWVNAIEIEKDRFECLVNNVGIYSFKNISFYNTNFLDIIQNLTHHVVFLDPPWGGINYKFKDKLKLIVTNIPIEDICIRILQFENAPKLIFLKLPKNYDLFFFYQKLKSFKVYLHKFNKINIIVVER